MLWTLATPHRRAKAVSTAPIQPSGKEIIADLPTHPSVRQSGLWGDGRTPTVGLLGHPGGLFGCRLYLFWGKGVAVDRVHGYQLVARAGARGAEATDVLRGFEQRMSREELRAARDRD